jgi:2,3-dihydroxybiphenyl 1,2-dioxygenase
MNTASSSITQLGYLGIEANDLDDWSRFAAGFLGMHVVEADADTLHLRMDERPARLFVTRANRNGLAWIGLEAGDALSLDRLSARLASAGTAIHRGSEEDCRARRVAALNWFLDPDGNRVELFHGPATELTAFVPAGAIGGFRTGDLGLGHVVLQTPRIEAMSSFYLDLGFRVSDYMDSPIDARFLHTNARHHSLALLHGPAAAIHHVMVEYLYLDDLGRLYDRAQATPDRIVTTLGRHTNDHMLSFYSRTPGGFMVETGWAGRLIDPESWQQERIASPSLWGHDRKWLPETARQAIRSEMERLAVLGVRAPVEVTPSPAFNISRLVHGGPESKSNQQR